jgi:hypothetical protein
MPQEKTSHLIIKAVITLMPVVLFVIEKDGFFYGSVKLAAYIAYIGVMAALFKALR